MRKLPCLILLVSCSIVLSAQAPAIVWQNTIGGSSSDNLRQVITTGDGGFLLGGESQSGVSGDKTEAGWGGSDYWLVKTGSDGVIEWENTIGGNLNDNFTSLIAVGSGGYLLGGYSPSGVSGDKTEASMGSFDYWILKVDDTGGIEWQQTIGGSSLDYLRSVVETDDGGFLLGGYSLSGISGDKTEASMGYDYWIIKIDSNGNLLWQNTIGGSGNDLLFDVEATDDSGFLLGGYSDSDLSGDKTEDGRGGYDYWVVKVNALGAQEWQRTLGGSSNDYLFSLAPSGDGGFLLGGYSDSELSGDKVETGPGGFDYWILKLDASGNEVWQNTIGGSLDDYLFSIAPSTDGSYLLGGHSQSGISGDKTDASRGDFDYWAVEVDASGSIAWQTTIGGSMAENLRSATATTDGGYLLGGYSSSGISGDKTEESLGSNDYWIVRLEGPALPCSVPTGLAVSGLSATSATLQWDAVDGDILGYKLQFRDMATGVTRQRKLPAGTTSVTLGSPAITPDNSYRFGVKTYCSDGSQSDWSDLYPFSTPLRRADSIAVFNVFPNPGSGLFTLQQSGCSGNNIQAEVYALTGEKVYSAVYSLQDGSLTTTLLLDQLPSGTYMLCTVAGDAVQTALLYIQ
ncbi:MAG TPA: T9SS C-terminal target domain-containing protein [Bacteroidetes bacterium]|nr:T9SS C-terminal target domain-containing protein [Bacteroidota bacterium]